MRRIVPPPCRRCPSGLAQGRWENVPSSSRASKAPTMRSCRFRKYAAASVARSASFTIGRLMDIVDEARDGIRIRIRPDAVAEIEDVSGKGTGVGEHSVHLRSQVRWQCKERGGIKIALNGLGAQDLPGSAERGPPVHSNHIHVELGDSLHEGGRLLCVIDDG